MRKRGRGRGSGGGAGGGVTSRSRRQQQDQAMQAPTSIPHDWTLRGIKLFNERNFEMATLCFERAGDEVKAKWAKAAGLYAAADRIISTDFEMARDLLIKAAEMYESIEKPEPAAKCFMMLKDYKRAGMLYRDKCAMSRLKEAGDCFCMAECWSLAADVYAKGKFFSEFLSVCTKGELFDEGLQYIEQWKENSSSEELEKIEEEDEVKISFLKRCALHYLELGDAKKMTHFVKAFGSLDLIRNFLESKNFRDEKVVVEDEAQNYMEAADIERMKGLHLLDPSFVKDAPSPELPEPNEAVALTLSQIKSFLERICTMSPASVVSSHGLGLCLVQFLHSTGYPATYFESKMQEAFKMAGAYVEKARASPLEVSTRAVSLIKSTAERHYANVQADVAVATPMLQSEKQELDKIRTSMTSLEWDIAELSERLENMKATHKALAEKERLLSTQVEEQQQSVQKSLATAHKYQESIQIMTRHLEQLPVNPSLCDCYKTLVLDSIESELHKIIQKMLDHF